MNIQLLPLATPTWHQPPPPEYVIIIKTSAVSYGCDSLFFGVNKRYGNTIEDELVAFGSADEFERYENDDIFRPVAIEGALGAEAPARWSLGPATLNKLLMLNNEIMLIESRDTRVRTVWADHRRWTSCGHFCPPSF